MFSVIIPLHNKEKFIHDTISCVLYQTFIYFEIIVVNDGSTDKSLNVLSEFDDSRIKIYNIPNSGVSSARNFGIGKSKYEWVAFLDADDLWSGNYLSEVYQIIVKNKSAKVIATNFYKHYSQNKKKTWI